MQGQQAVQSSPQGDERDIDAMMERARKRLQSAQNRDRRDDEEAQSDLLMRAGGENQWDQAALRERKRDGRPIYTANRFPAAEGQIIGEIQANPPSIHCAPADGDATMEVAQVFEGLIRCIERFSNTAQVYSSVGAASTRAGRGHMRINPVYADDEGRDVELRIKEIKDVLSVKWGPAEEFDKSDARWCLVVTQLDKTEFDENYKGKDGLQSATWANARNYQRRVDGWHSGDSNKVTVAEEWCVEKTPYTRIWATHSSAIYGGPGGIQIIQPTGQEVVIDGDDNADTIDGLPTHLFIQGLEAQGFQITHRRTAYRKRVVMYLWGGDKLLGTHEWLGSRIPIFTVPGRQVHMDGQTIHEGIIRHSRDTQRLINYARSVDLEYVSQAPKATVMIADKAIQGYEDEWHDSLIRPVPYVRYNAQSGVPKPEIRPGPSTNPGPQALAQAGSIDFEDTTGIHAASLGKKSNETSGVAIAERDAQTNTGTNTFVFHLRWIVESLGNELVVAIPKYYTARQKLLILGPDDMPAIVDLAQRNLDLSIGKYLVSVKTGPAYATMREKAAEMVAKVLPITPEPAVPILFETLFELTEIPNGDRIAQRIKQAFVMAGLVPPEDGMGNPAMPMPGMPPGMPGMPPGMPMPAPIAMPMPPRRPSGRGPDPLAGIGLPFPPPGVPAARPVVGDTRMRAAPPGM